MSPNGDDSRLANSKQIGRGILHADTNGISRCQVHPVQGSLHIRKPRLQSADNVGIWSNSKTYAVHDAGKARIWFRHYINIGPHSGRDVLELTFSEVTDGPPRPSVD